MSKAILALDIGEKRIGVAQGDIDRRIAFPYDTIEVDSNEVRAIAELVMANEVKTLVVGYPRNQSGEPTKQTAYVEEFVKTIAELDIDAEIVYQDESLTSVQAEARLGTRIKNKGEIDAEAASIILQDYLEAQYAH